MSGRFLKKNRGFLGALLAAAFLGLGACASLGASAEEYYTLGMAYFDLGRYAEAEQWLNRARTKDKTKVASEYNLGRIAYEQGRYPEAARYFDRVLLRDPVNVMALKAAAYTRIKTGEFSLAAALYARVLALEPEGADDGYNYALVLFAMEKYAEAGEVLDKYPFSLAENNDTLLLSARILGAQNKIEAADRYDQWLQNNSDPLVRYEYAQILEKAELYARALEQYREVLNSLPRDNQNPSRQEVRFTTARLYLIADSENEEGLRELRAAVAEGFTDTDKIAALLEEKGVSDAARDEIELIIEGIKNPPKEEAAEPEEPAV